MSDKKLEECLNQWDSFCDTAKEAGRKILEESRGMDDVTQADGLRYLTRLLRGGIEKFVEYDDPVDPIIYKVYHEKLKWGGDNPDSIYSMSSIDGNYDYEMRGNRGTINYFNISALEMSTDGKLVTTGFIDCEDLKTDKDGNFSIILSTEKPTSEANDSETTNWLPIATTSNSIMIRQTFVERAKETELVATIKLISSIETHKALQLDKALAAVSKAEGFFANTGKTFTQLSQAMYKNVNKLPPVDLEYIKSMGGDPNYAYFWSAFQVAPGKALLVHLPKEPECDTWSLCLHNYWLESLDYHKSTIILNKYTSTKNSDGSVTMVVSMDDPGVDNWLDTCGHPLGQMIFRWTKTKEVVVPEVELVDLDNVNWPQKLQRW